MFRGRTVTAPPATSPNQWNIHSLSWSSASKRQPVMLMKPISLLGSSKDLFNIWMLLDVLNKTVGPQVFLHSFLHPIHLFFRRGWHKKHWHSSQVIQDTRDECQPFSPYEVTHPQSPGLHDIEMCMTSGWGQRSDMGMIAYDLWDSCIAACISKNN